LRIKPDEREDAPGYEIAARVDSVNMIYLLMLAAMSQLNGGAVSTRQPCCHIPRSFAELRPVALRPALSNSLPFSSFLKVYIVNF